VGNDSQDKGKVNFELYQYLEKQIEAFARIENVLGKVDFIIW